MDSLLAAKKSGSGAAQPSLNDVSPATRLLEKRRQMFEVQDALERAKEEAARREESFARREEALRAKDLELQESLLKFNKFLQENESKRTRAVKRATEEANQRRVKESEIIKLEEQLASREKEEAAMRQQLQQHEKYRYFLQQVVEGEESEYHEVSDVLLRYRALKTANTDLAATLQGLTQSCEEGRAQLGNFKKERGNVNLGATNAIAGLQRKVEAVQAATRQRARDLEAAVAGGSNKTRELGQVLRSVENLLDRVRTSRAERQGIKLRPGQTTGGGGSGGDSGGDNNQTGGGNGGGGDEGPRNAGQLAEEASKAEQRLHEVSESLLDYVAIVDEWAAWEERRLREIRERAAAEEEAKY